MRKQSRIIVLLVSAIICLTVGYSIYSQSIDTIGTATLNGKFDVSYYSIGEITESDCSDTTAVISNDKKLVVIDVPKMEKVGAYAIVPITVKNNSSVSVKLLSIEEKGININSLVRVTYTGIGISDAPLRPGKTTTFYVKVEWTQGEIAETSKAYFSLRLNYIQS